MVIFNRIHRYFIYFLMLSGSGHCFAQLNADAITGIWQTEPKEDGSYAHVEILKSGQVFNGRIVWLSQPNENGKPKTDHQNPDKGKQGVALLGLNLLKGFEFDGDDNWENGTIYDPSNGNTYKCYLWLENPEVLKLKGYIGISLIGRTATWKKVKK